MPAQRRVDVTIDIGAVREALEVLRRQQARTAQGLGRLQALGTSHWVESEPDARLMKGHGPSYNVQTVVDAEHALIVTHEVRRRPRSSRDAW